MTPLKKWDDDGTSDYMRTPRQLVSITWGNTALTYIRTIIAYSCPLLLVLTLTTNHVSLTSALYTAVVLTSGRLPCCAAVSLCALPRAAGSSVGGGGPRNETAHWCQVATWCSHCFGCPRAPFTHTHTHRKAMVTFESDQCHTPGDQRLLM